MVKDQFTVLLAIKSTGSIELALKYKTYPKMKDSGIEWIGEIPEHWNKKRLKFSVHLHSDKSNSGETRPYLGLENIESGTRRLIDVNYEMEDADAKLFETDDVLFGKLRPYLAKVFLAKFSGRCSGEFLVFTGIDFIPEFLASLLISDGCIKIVDSSTYGTKMPRAEWDFIGNMTFTIPPKPEQKQISDYLDSQTKLIDSQIESNQKLVSLLQEKRQATINQAVTKGLDPTVPMKDSGIDWIGKIPETWKIKKLKFVSNVVGRIGFRGYTVDDIVGEGEGAVTLSPSNIIDDQFNLNKKTYLSWLKYDESPEIQIFKNDILIVKTGSTIGKVCIVNDETEKMTINPQLIVLKSLKLIPKFLYYFITCNKFKDQIFSYIFGGSTPTTSQEKISNHYVLSPPTEQQKQISDYLDKRTSKFDSLISKTESQIEKLQEFRQSLISSAVTGKIDVRELT